MLNIDFLTLKAFFIENIDFLIGSRLQKIQQPTRKDFILSLRNSGDSRKLYINISPQIYHICFMSPQNEKKRCLEIPKHPPMFCMLLRKYLEGCRIADAKVIERERIIEFHFDTMDELSQNRSLCLCIELMGKHSNVILYDRESFVIIGCAHNVGAEKSRYRELQGGLKYIYPPSSQELSNELKKQFSGLNSQQIDEYLNSETFRPAIFDDKYTMFQELLPNSELQNSVNETIDNYYSTIQNNLIIKSEKSRLSAIVLPKLKKVKNSIDKITTLLKKRDNTDKYKLYGELLTANLYLKSDFQDEIELFDYVNNKNIVIPLDNTLTLKENAQKYYKLYTKSKLTKEKSAEMLNSLNVEKEYLENILYSINNSDNIEDFDDIDMELGNKNSCNTPKNPKDGLIKLEIGGYHIYVGKNNKQNDYIVSKLAKDEDFWFHTRLCAGSHVLLQTKSQEPPEEILWECCKLAKKYSSASLSSKVGIIYTRAKNLKKPPSAPLGYVIYKNEKEVLVD